MGERLSPLEPCRPLVPLPAVMDSVPQGLIILAISPFSARWRGVSRDVAARGESEPGTCRRWRSVVVRSVKQGRPPADNRYVENAKGRQREQGKHFPAAVAAPGPELAEVLV
jgi:hypothetical protein